MSTTIRPEISPNKKYWIDRHRYYELRHFCLQYPIWKKIYDSLNGIGTISVDVVIVRRFGEYGDPTAKRAEARVFYSDRIEMLEKVAKETDPVIGPYILQAVTSNLSYEKLNSRSSIPCCKDVYYELYRRFFWLLDKARG